MKVKELIEELEQLDPESECIMQGDSEGNSYSPLAGVDGNAVYVEESSWSGIVYGTDYTADDNCMEEEEWEELKAGPRCVVLFPVN